VLAVNTDRLLVIPCPLHIAKAIIFNRPYVETFLLATVPDDWPSPELKAYLPYYIEELEQSPSILGWGIWIAIHAQEKVVVGDIGFKGKPDGEGSIEIGYSVHPSQRQKGYAYEATKGLTDWAFSEGNVQNIRAECDSENIASIKVLQKLGMKDVTANNDSLFKWKMDSPYKE
jgi:ribosomal-protein-alanine N-acetyltransferase